MRISVSRGNVRWPVVSTGDGASWSWELDWKGDLVPSKTRDVF